MSGLNCNHIVLAHLYTLVGFCLWGTPTPILHRVRSEL
jgi:hypothetical protein